MPGIYILRLVLQTSANRSAALYPWYSLSSEWIHSGTYETNGKDEIPMAKRFSNGQIDIHNADRMASGRTGN